MRGPLALLEGTVYRPHYRFTEDAGRPGVTRCWLYRGDELIVMTARRDLAERLIRLLEADDASLTARPEEGRL